MTPSIINYPYQATILLLLTLCLPLTLHAEVYVALPKKSFEVKYSIDYPEQRLYPATKYPLMGESQDAYFIKYDFGDAVHVVELPKRRNGRSVAHHQGKSASVTGTLFIDFEKGVIMVERGTPYRVNTIQDGKAEIIVSVGDGKRRVPFPETLFRIMPEREYEAALARESQPTESVASQKAQKPKLNPDQLAKLAEQEKRKAKQIHAGKRKTAFTPVNNTENAVGLITTAEGSGTGFLCQMDGVIYFFTNSHVIGSGRDLKIRLRDGSEVVPQLIELAQDRDLARISIDKQPAALNYTKEAHIGEKVVVYGNSKGAGVITRITGKVKGDAHDRIETSAKFVPGNSGSPIVNEDGTVIGVATYAINETSEEDWVTKGTDFDKVRRFGVKVDEEIEWVPFHPEALAMLNREIIDSEDRLFQSIELMQQYYGNPMSPIISANIDDEALKQWVMAHNAVIKEYAALGNRSYTPHEISKIRDVIFNRGRAKGRTLTTYFKRQADAMETLPLIPETGFHREKVNELKMTFSALAEANENLNSTIW